MASIAVEPVVTAIVALIEGLVEKGVEASVVEAVTASVNAVIGAAVTRAVQAAIIQGISTVVSVSIGAAVKTEVKGELEKTLSKDVKDVIGQQGLDDLSEAMTKMPSDDKVVNRLVKAALDALDHHLWVFNDPVFLRLTKLVRALRAVKKGEKPDDDDGGGDDCDEEKCRFFHAPEVTDDSEDFIFFSVFGNEKCDEGDEVYSMSAQCKKLKSLVEDPIGGHFVSQLFQELNESCAEDVDEEDTPLQAGIDDLLAVSLKRVLKIAKSELVDFRNKKIYNIKGTSVDKRMSSWKGAYFVVGYDKCYKCYIDSEEPPCGHTDPLEGNIVGGHMWTPALKKKDKSLYYYILPICKRHNKRIVYDVPSSNIWLKTTSDAWAMKVTSISKVPGWKGLMALFGAKPSMLLMVAAGSDGESGECHEITPPKEFTNWLLEEIHKIALEFAKDPIETVTEEVAAIVLKKLGEIVKSSGKVAIDWTNSEGNNIMLQSLIPIYGIYQAIKRLSSLESDAMNKFHNEASLALTNYKNECLGDAEQARRSKRLSEETDKVISSKKWKDRLVAFEATVASKVPTLLTPSIKP